jgi:ribosomal protein L22
MATAEEPRTSVRAEARYVRTAPRKAQLVAEQIRGRPVPEARTILAFMTRDAARDVEKVLSSAVANAEANHGLDGDELFVSLATVGSGPTPKRWRARARGRVARIKKRTCHITIALALPEEQVIPEPVQRPVPAAAPEPEPAPEPEAMDEQEETPKTKPAASKKPAEKAEKPKPKRTTKPKAAADKPKAEKPTADEAKTEKPKPKTTRKKKESDS